MGKNSELVAIRLAKKCVDKPIAQPWSKQKHTKRCLAEIMSDLIKWTFLPTGYIHPWSGRFYSLWDTGYAKIHIPIIASVSEHQPTTWVSFFFDLHILVCAFPAGVWYCIKEVNDERVFGEITLPVTYLINCMKYFIVTGKSFNFMGTSFRGLMTIDMVMDTRIHGFQIIRKWINILLVS